MSSQRDVQNRIASVQNIRKITRAMEMVAAARLRRAEQRIEHLRPYADAIRRMTRQAAEAAGSYVGFTERPNFPDAREIAQDLMAGFIDDQVDRVEIFYNGYISPLSQEVRRETLLPLQQATILGEGEGEGDDGGQDAAQE